MGAIPIASSAAVPGSGTAGISESGGYGGMSEQLAERPGPRLSNMTGTDICFHCHSIGRKCTRIDGGLCREAGREQ